MQPLGVIKKIGVAGAICRGLLEGLVGSGGFMESTGGFEGGTRGYF